MWWFRGALVTLTCLATCACGDEPDSDTSPLLTSPPGFDSGDEARIQGPVTFTSGCILVGGSPTVFPDGTRWDESAQQLQLPNDQTIRLEEEVVGGGGFHDADWVAEYVGDTGGQASEKCLSGEIFVLNHVQAVS